ncbi:La protein homolog [Talaromyces islandicus]|uniref:La protein homolog n=1 Tax=Talaromyces islandicus TaxID=28573 RepID=A0A0U1M3Y0_TALIS|nr:La protein homolog [Talaromyces islandicus]
MSGEVKATEAPANGNTEAEKDVQNLLSELKGEGEKPEKESKPEAADDEEARIIAAASKLGQESAAKESKESKPVAKDRQQQGGRRTRNYRDNIKSDLTSQETTDDPKEIRKQVEFYFSDSNLPMDNYLLKLVGGSANEPVELAVLHTFKRMRRFQPFSAIVEALKSSETLELLENDTKIRRKVPLPESVNDFLDPDVVKVFENEAMGRSIYAKGFGEETSSTQLEIEKFFAQFGPTNAIRLRRAYDKTFKGSVFVEFDTEETQKKFLELDPKPKWNGQDLLIKSKKDYCDEKVRDIQAGKIKPGRGRGRGRGGRGGRGGRHGEDKRDWRDRRDEDQRKGFRDNRGGRGGRGRDPSPPRNTVEKDSRGVPVIKSSADDKPSSGQKRGRDEEDANGSQPSKKVDAKGE